MLGAPAKTKETANVLTTLSNASQQLLRMLPTSPDHVQTIQQALPAPPKQQQAVAEVQARPALDVTAFLTAPSCEELRRVRLMAHLCSQTYYMGQLTPRKVKLWHGLELISTSLCCERLVYLHSRTEDEMLSEGDGMAGPSLLDALDLYSSTNIHNLHGEPNSSSNMALAPSGAVAVSSVNNVVPFPPADRVVREAIAGITSAEIASSHPNSSEVKAASTSAGSKCPSEWFVADDETSNIRYFVIQGSDSLDHWKTNLMFEPVLFEGPDMGVRVHRGAYEAACALYDRFLPLVQEHVDRDPVARVCFTGHSIGGAMAVLLMLMFRHRGVLHPEQIGPVYTFGSPAVFCDGALGGWGPCSQQQPGHEPDSCTLGASLMSRLGLSEDIIRSVMTTRDIVPRAFSCDYSLVAELLRSWGPNWREHTCLSGGASGAGRRQLYVHLGRMLVLQPSPELTFITEGKASYLPMLPAKPGVYELLNKPSLASQMAAARNHAQSLRHGIATGVPATSRDQVLAAIMDTPHPLDTLADPGAYGPAGSISRYHNPDHYCRALGRVLADRRGDAADALQQWTVPANASRHRPFFPVHHEQQ
eukprot:gene12659-12786_t